MKGQVSPQFCCGDIVRWQIQDTMGIVLNDYDPKKNLIAK